MRLSVLDQSPIPEGGAPAEAVAQTVALAQLCESLGYTRYWFAEHHNTPSYAGSCPEILIARVAAETSRIRLGSGGVMLTHYSPLKVAEQFRMLEVLSPGRIDLGLGRSTGADEQATRALQPGPESLGLGAFPNQLELVQQYLNDATGVAPLPDDHPFPSVHAAPQGPSRPDVWLLGAGVSSATYAAENGLPFCYAYFVSQNGSEEACAAYHDRFKPSTWCARPQLLMCVSATAAETDDAAKQLAESRYLWGAQMVTGGLSCSAPFLPPEKALAHQYSAEERIVRDRFERGSIVGSAQTVHDQLSKLADRHRVEELVLLTITYDPAARRRSYELLAEAFGLVAA